MCRKGGQGVGLIESRWGGPPGLRRPRSRCPGRDRRLSRPTGPNQGKLPAVGVALGLGCGPALQQAGQQRQPAWPAPSAPTGVQVTGHLHGYQPRRRPVPLPDAPAQVSPVIARRGIGSLPRGRDGLRTPRHPGLVSSSLGHILGHIFRITVVRIVCIKTVGRR